MRPRARRRYNSYIRREAEQGILLYEDEEREAKERAEAEWQEYMEDMGHFMLSRFMGSMTDKTLTMVRSSPGMSQLRETLILGGY